MRGRRRSVPKELEGSFAARVLDGRGRHVAAAHGIRAPGASADTLAHLRAVAAAAALAGIGGGAIQGVAGGGAAATAVVDRKADVTILDRLVVSEAFDDWARHAVERKSRKRARTLVVEVYDGGGRRSSKLRLTGARPVIYERGALLGGARSARRLVLSQAGISWVVDAVESSTVMASAGSRRDRPRRVCFLRGAAGAAAAAVAIATTTAAFHRRDGLRPRAHASAATGWLAPPVTALPLAGPARSSPRPPHPYWPSPRRTAEGRDAASWRPTPRP